jgi:hypothetical protein
VLAVRLQARLRAARGNAHERLLVGSAEAAADLEVVV